MTLTWTHARPMADALLGHLFEGVIGLHCEFSLASSQRNFSFDHLWCLGRSASELVASVFTPVFPDVDFAPELAKCFAVSRVYPTLYTSVLFILRCVPHVVSS